MTKEKRSHDRGERAHDKSKRVRGQQGAHDKGNKQHMAEGKCENFAHKQIFQVSMCKGPHSWKWTAATLTPPSFSPLTDLLNDFCQPRLPQPQALEFEWPAVCVRSVYREGANIRLVHRRDASGPPPQPLATHLLSGILFYHPISRRRISLSGHAQNTPNVPLPRARTGRAHRQCRLTSDTIGS